MQKKLWKKHVELRGDPEAPSTKGKEKGSANADENKEARHIDTYDDWD